MPHPLYVLILAGGSGERFWPLSRKSRPKQLLALFSDETLLAATLRRLDGLVPVENILILTNSDQAPAVRQIAPQLPHANIVAEPAKRDTAAAIALGVSWVAARDPSATMIVLPADHLINDVAAFQKTLRAAVAAAEQSGEIVTIGIKPTWACPGFGYIEKGTPFSNSEPPVFEVVSFREKPNADLAETFLQQGDFRWNAGMFIWPVATIRAAFQQHAPVLAEFIRESSQAKASPAFLATAFPALPKISIDYAVMEKAARVLVVEAAFDWDDVGSWTAIAKYLGDQGSGNVSNTALQTLDASGNIVFSSQKLHIAIVGVSDLIVVQTPDALLICHRHEAEKIKQLVATAPPALQ